MGSDQTNNSDVEAYLESLGLDAAADYAKRGRRFSKLSDNELRDEWKRAFQALANNPLSSDARTLEAHLSGEFSLRGLQRPFQDVAHALKLYRTNAERELQKFLELPGVSDAANRRLAANLAAFKRRKESS